jgi:hypothetical protein
MPVTPATQEVEIRKIKIRGQLRQKARDPVAAKQAWHGGTHL